MRAIVEEVADYGNVARSTGIDALHHMEGKQVFIGKGRFKVLIIAGDETGGRFAPGPHKRTYAGASEGQRSDF